MNNQEYILKSEINELLERKIKILEEGFDELDSGNKMYFSGYISGLKKFLSELDNLSGVSGWIDVKERLPEEGEKVFGFNPIVGHCVSEIIITNDAKVIHYPCEFTHWMPLPPHP